MSFEEIDLQWFAAEDEGRTEQPSDTKLQKAREEGRVAKSQELNSAFVMLVCVLVLILSAPYFLKWCEQILVYYFTRCTVDDFMQGQFFIRFLINMAKMVLPMSLAGMTAAVITNLVQNKGFIFSTKPIEPKFSNIVPKIGQYLKKTIFSAEGLLNVVKSLVKVFLIVLIAVLIIRANVAEILELLNTVSIRMAAGRIAGCAAQILIYCSVLFIVIAIFDYFFIQRRQFIESMKMSKQEMKQEFKEQEGDPEVKQKLQQAQRELLRQNLPKAVSESDVVITNPTHYSVAVKYDSSRADLPMVNAKGEGRMAFRIRELADENGIPRVENVPLARSLYSQVEVGGIIPEEYIKAIVAVYTQIGYLNKKK